MSLESKDESEKRSKESAAPNANSEAVRVSQQRMTLYMAIGEACYNPTQTIRLLSHVFREASTCNRNITRLLRTQTVRLCCFFAVNDFQNFWTDADWRNM